MEEKNWLEPTEVVEYDEDLGNQCMEDPENNWENKIEDKEKTEFYFEGEL